MEVETERFSIAMLYTSMRTSYHGLPPAVMDESLLSRRSQVVPDRLILAYLGLRLYDLVAQHEVPQSLKPPIMFAVRRRGS